MLLDVSKDDEPRTEHLAAEATEADADAFAVLVERVRGRLETWIALRLGPKLRGRITEEDVLQETLLQAFRTLDTFTDTGPGSFRRWLLSVAENRIRDLHKFHGAQKRDVAREIARPRNAAEVTLLDRLSISGASPASAAHALDARRRLAGTIDALPQELREVVVARALEERPFREIAQQLGRPVTTIQAQFARAIRALRDNLEG